MRTVDNSQIKAHAAVRFRSEYHYAVFEYWRSAKMLLYLQRAGIESFGQVLDDGCGGGGMCVSLAEEAPFVVGIDLADRFRDAGERLAREKGVENLRFVQADATRLPFDTATFDQVLSHAVIEHVTDPGGYLREAKRVLKPGGTLFLQTAPALSFHGSHLPRLKVPIPLYLVIGRRAAFATSWWLARHAPGCLAVGAEESSFVMLARKGETKTDDLYYLVTVRNLREHIDRAGLTIVKEDLYVSRLATRLLPAPLSSRIPDLPLVRDILVTNMEYVITG